jgi:FkbH-like protein
MSQSLNLRKEIDAAAAAGHTGRALSLVKQLWFAEPTLANAPFVIDRVAKLPTAVAPIKCHVMMLRSFTVEPMVPLLRAAGACWGLDISVRVGEFNAYVQEILNPASPLYTEDVNVAVLAVQTRDIAPELWSLFTELSETDITTVVERVTQDYRNWVTTIRSRSQTNIIIHNLEKPASPAAGIYDAQDSRGQSQAIERINAALKELAAGISGVYVLDYDNLIARHGRNKWHDERKWLTARLPLAGDSLIHLVDEWLRYLVPLSGKQAKCLVCDLDNTLWGGVIGEEGMTGIKLGADYPGAAYQELQRAIIDLSRRGVILAIASKNNPDDALEAIDKHEGMLLRSKDFAVTRINWVDKAQNLHEIAAELNIGIDSLVLLDDNPVEREFIREMIPEMTVIDIDAADPFGHAPAVRRCPLFERLEISAEDKKRNKLYAEQQQRTALQASAGTVEDYYLSLAMVATFGEADPATRQRIAQLTQKTNQLNMTTRRYSEQAIQQMMDDPTWRVLWTRVEDRFGDNGIIGVMIAHEQGDDWLIDTFLMSCRVIGRTVETAMLGVLAERAREAGAKRLLGPFIPTAKNAPAQKIYADNDFRCIEEGDKESLWELNLSTSKLAPPEWIECRFEEHEVKS